MVLNGQGTFFVFIYFVFSNAVKFLRNAIEYDKQWIDTFDESEGLYIEKIKHNLFTTDICNKNFQIFT